MNHPMIEEIMKYGYPLESPFSVGSKEKEEDEEEE